MQGRRNSSALTIELCLPCTNPSIPIYHPNRKYKDYIYGRCSHRSTYKNKEYLRSKDKAKNDMMHISKYKKMKIYYPSVFYVLWINIIWPSKELQLYAWSRLDGNVASAYGIGDFLVIFIILMSCSVWYLVYELNLRALRPLCLMI